MGRGKAGRVIEGLLIARDSGFMRGGERKRGGDCAVDGCQESWQDDGKQCIFGRLPFFSCIAAGRGMAFAWRFGFCACV